MELQEAVAMETVTLCGFDVPVFRGAQPIPDELVAKLKQPLSSDAISANSDPKKRGMSSIKSIFVTERLNEVFGLGQWFQVDKFIEKVAKPEGSGKGDSIVLKSILVVPKFGIYFEAYGGNDNYDPGDAYKGACTDALTKMAAFLGVGIDVFKGHPETSKEVSKAAPKASIPAPTPKLTTPVAGFDTMPAHSDQAPAKPVQSVGRPINATEKRAFWSAVKQGKKSPEAVRDYFGKIGIEKTEQMRQPAFDAAMKWACNTEKAVQS